MAKKQQPAKQIEHIGDLIPDAKNARRHNPRNVGMIVDSLQSVGAARSIVIDEAGNILAGNGTIEAAAEAGITKLQAEWEPDVLAALRDDGLLEGFFFEDELAGLLNESPNFPPASEDEQGRLDQKKPHTCPECGHEFTD